MDLTRAARNDTKPFHPLTSLECLDQIEEVLLHGWALRAKRTRTHHGMQVDAKAAMRTTGDILVHLVVGFPSASRSVGERKRHGNSSRRCKILASAQEKIHLKIIRSYVKSARLWVLALCRGKSVWDQ